MIKITCPSCDKRLELPEEAAGKKGKCPGCGGVFDVPEAVSSPGASAVDAREAPAPGETKAGKFSIKEAIGFGWRTMKGNLGFFIGLLIVAGLIYAVPEVIAGFLEGAGLGLVGLGVRVIDAVLAVTVSLGLYKIPLNFCDGVKSKIADLLLHYRFFFRYVFSSILYVLACAAGFVLLIFPGIYLAIRLSFYIFFIVDKNAGIVESLKGSWRITRGSAWKLFLYSIVITGVNILGALVLAVGLFATIPTSMVAGAFIYRRLLASSEMNGAAADAG